MGFEETRIEQLSDWMRGDGETLTGTIGARQDAQLAELKAAVKLRYPGPVLDVGAVEALPHLGQERRVFRFPELETPQEYAARLERAPLYWHWAGTESAMFNVFEPVDPTYLPPTETTFTTTVLDGYVTVINNRHEPSYSGLLYVTHPDDGPVADPDWYSAYAMVFDARASHWTIGPDWDDWVWDDDHLWDTNITVQEARYLLLQILAWKSVISYPVRIGFMLTGAPTLQFWGANGVDWDAGWDWEGDPVSDTPFLTIGHMWQEHAGQGGWINDAAPHTYQVWDGGWLWAGYENPLLFGVQE